MPTPPGPTKNSLGDRRLAAIVFTDVAGFSALVEKNERRTLMLVQRDLKLIGDVFKKFGGDVLKNTGDGCLSAFPSVESAVGSAIKIQRIVADARHRLPPEEVLHHRIGIHLGDVFFGQGDVLGQGVNIAARLLGEAQPDGICISQTVYDLVKHRLDIKAVCIGARELKNIREAVQVYRLVLKAVAQEEETTAPPAKPAKSGNWLIPAAALFALVTIGLAAWFIVRSAKSNASNPAAAATVAPAAPVAPIVSAASTTPPAGPSTEPAANLARITGTLQLHPDYSVDSAVSWQRFRTFSNNFLTTSIDDGSYVMTVHSGTFRICLSNSPWTSFGDVTIQAGVRIHGPPASSWGLELLSSEGSRQLVRAMSATGGVLKVDLTRLEGVDQAGTPLNPSGFYSFGDPSIHRSDESNTMVMDVHDHRLTVLVNGQKMGTPWDIKPLGKTTLVLVVEGTDGAVATFKQLNVWLPQPSPK